MSRFATAFPLALLLLSGAARASALDELAALDAPADYAGRRDAALQGLGDDELQEALASSDWRLRLEARALQAWREHPAGARAIWEAVPGVTRAGSLRFTSNQLGPPELAPVWAERLLHGGGEPELRAAVLDAAVRAGGGWEDAALALLRDEPDPWLRSELVAAFQRAPAEQAVQALSLGLRDPDPGVRAQAARVAGWQQDAGRQLLPQLRDALEDAEPRVRATAARSLGWLGDTRAAPRLLPLLDDADAEVRLRALRALSQLDPSALDAGRLSALQRDPDSRVARLAGRLAAGR